MDINKRLSKDKRINKNEHGSWNHARNIVVNNDNKSISNELGFSKHDKLEFTFIGKIDTPELSVIFSTGLGGEIEHTAGYIKFFKIETFDLDNNLKTILRTKHMQYDEHPPVSGKYTYDRNKDLIISWWNGIETNSNRLCILNINTLPFIDPLDANKELTTNANDEISLIYQHSNIKVPRFNLLSVEDNNGVMKTGSYLVGIRYLYKDGDMTLVSNFSRPIVITPSVGNDEFSNYMGDKGNTRTSKAIKIKIDNLDIKFEKYQVVVYTSIEGIQRAYSADTLNVDGSEDIVILDGKNFIEISKADIIIDSALMYKVDTGTVIEDRLVVASIEDDDSVNLQEMANSIDVQWVYEDPISLDGLKGSYKNPLMVFHRTGFMPGEVVALYVAGRLNSGKLTKSYHIPGRLPLANDLQPVANDANFAECVSISNGDGKRFQFETIVALTSPTTGRMGYWHNEDEIYPSTMQGLTGNVRHHKFPDANYLNCQFNAIDTIENIIGQTFANMPPTVSIDLVPNLQSAASLTDNSYEVTDDYTSAFGSSTYARTHVHNVLKIIPITTTINNEFLESKQFSNMKFAFSTAGMVYAAQHPGTTYFAMYHNFFLGMCFNRAYHYFNVTDGISGENRLRNTFGINDIEPTGYSGIVSGIRTIHGNNFDQDNDKELTAISSTSHLNSSGANTLFKAKQSVVVRVTGTITFLWNALRGGTSGCNFGQQDDVVPELISIGVYKATTNKTNYLNYDGNLIEYSNQTLVFVTENHQAYSGSITIDETIYLELGESLVFRMLLGHSEVGVPYNDNPSYLLSADNHELDINIISNTLRLDVFDISELNLDLDGSMFGRVLGLKFGNIIIPHEANDKLQALEFFYAKRDIFNASKITEDSPLLGSTQAEIISNPHSIFKMHPFDLFAGGKANAKGKYLDMHTQMVALNNQANNNYEYNLLTDTYCFTTAHRHREYSKAEFVAPNNKKGVYDNDKREEAIVATFNIDREIPAFSIGTLSNYYRNMYKDFYNQTLVSTGLLIYLDDYSMNQGLLANTLALKHYGGDTYFSLYYKRIIHDMVESYIAIPVRTFANVGLRHGNDDDEMFYPRNDAGNYLAKLDEMNGQLTTFNLSDIHTTWDYNIDYSILNEFKSSAINNPTILHLYKFPYRIARSPKQGNESQLINWRNFREDEYYEMPKNKGAIRKLESLTDVLIIHTEFSLFIAKVKDVLELSATENSYLGKGDIFDREPNEIILDKNGYFGTVNSIANIVTRIGYLAIDVNRRIIGLFNGKDVQELQNIEMATWFDKALQMSNNQDNPYTRSGIITTMDDYNNRLILTIKDAYPLADITDGRYNSILDSGTVLTFEILDTAIYETITIRLFVTNAWTNIVLPVINADGKQLAIYTLPNSISVLYILQPEVTVRLYNGNLLNNMTMSYDIALSGWVAEHDYNPSVYMNNRNKISIIDDNNLFVMNNGNYGVYTDDTINESYVDIILKEPIDVDKIFESISFETEVLDSDNVLIPNKTISALYIYDDNQCTNRLEINKTNQEWFEQESGREVTATWYFNEFRDAIINNLQPFISYRGAIDHTKLDNDIQVQKDWFDKSEFISKYVVVRLIIDNKDNLKVILNSIASKTRKAHR
jgi:hypothetical protein